MLFSFEFEYLIRSGSHGQYSIVFDFILYITTVVILWKIMSTPHTATNASYLTKKAWLLSMWDNFKHTWSQSIKFYFGFLSCLKAALLFSFSTFIERSKSYHFTWKTFPIKHYFSLWAGSHLVEINCEMYSKGKNHY